MTRERPGRDLGIRVATARKARGITQEQLADACRVKKATISMLESGFRIPKVDMLIRLASALHVSPTELLGTAADDLLPATVERPAAGQ